MKLANLISISAKRLVMRPTRPLNVFDCVFSSELIFPINYGIKFIQTQREMSFTVLKWLHGSGVAVLN